MKGSNGGEHRALMRNTEMGELVERCVVGLDGLVGGFER